MTTTTPPDPQTATQADIEGWLVGLRCPECGEHCHKQTPKKPHFDILNTACEEHGIVHICDCYTCNATGLRFPFTRPCLRHGGTDWAGGPSCDHCTDGRVAAVTLEVVLDAIEAMYPDLSVGLERHGDTYAVDIWNSMGSIHPYYGDWPTRLEAAIRALAMAVQAEVKDEV